MRPPRSLLKLLLGLYRPTSGNILLGRTPLTPANAPAWRNAVGAVLQERATDMYGWHVVVPRYIALYREQAEQDLATTKLYDIVHPAHRLRLQQELERVLDGGEPRRFPVEYVAADDRVVILSGSSQPVEVDGEAVATQSLLRDVTEQRLAERRLAESQQKLEALVENTGDSIWSIDRDHRLLTLNSAFSLAVEARTGREPSVGERPDDRRRVPDVEHRARFEGGRRGWCASIASCTLTIMKSYMCLICGFVYNEEEGDPESGIAPGTRWDDVPLSWRCPDCGAGKEDFEMVEI